MSLLLIINLILLFLIGFVQDLLSAYYLRLVTEQRLLMATFISFVHSIIAWLILIWCMYLLQNKEAMTAFQMVIYSAGAAFGTFLGLRRPGGQGIKP